MPLRKLGKGCRFADDNRRHRDLIRQQAQRRPGLTELEPGAGKADPAAAQSSAMSRQHQVLRGEAAILRRLARGRPGADDDQTGRSVEYLRRIY